MVPASWSGLIPECDYACEEWPCINPDVTVLPGLCPGGERDVMLCIENSSLDPALIEPGTSLAIARLPPEGVKYHRRGESQLEGEPEGSIVQEFGGLLLEAGTSSIASERYDRVCSLASEGPACFDAVIESESGEGVHAVPMERVAELHEWGWRPGPTESHRPSADGEAPSAVEEGWAVAVGDHGSAYAAEPPTCYGYFRVGVQILMEYRQRSIASSQCNSPTHIH